GVHADDHGQARRALAPHQRQPSRLGLRRHALAAAAAAAERLAPRLDLLPRAAIPADAREVATRRLVDVGALRRVFQRADFRLHLPDLLEVLILAEGRFDARAQELGRRAGAEQERDRAIAELELALDRLGRAVHDAQQILEPVARIQRDHALPLGVDAAAARAAGHLRELVV